MPAASDAPLEELVSNRIWVKKYPVHYAGLDFFARTTMSRLSGGELFIHSPSPIDEGLAECIRGIGPVAPLIAPGAWANELDQGLVRGNRLIWEVVFVDKPTKTLIVTDLLENIGEKSGDVGWQLKLWWKVVFHMWDNPKPAPEYQMGWKGKGAARRSLERILEWDFDRIILSHGDNIESDAKAVLRRAWAKPLSFEG